MVTIRAATEDDIDGVLGLWEAAGAVASAGANRDGLVRLLTRDPGALIVAADDGGAVVGSVIAGFDGWRGGIYRLAVDPALRLTGIATRLLDAADERLRRLGCPRAAAIVLRDRPVAMGFWESSGYAPQPEVLRFTRQL